MKKLMSIYVLNLLFISNIVLAAEKPVTTIQNWTLKKSVIKYVVTFPLKTVIGKSTQAKGKAICENQVCEVLVAVPLNSFDSGDTNRDMHMLEVTKGAEFPLITFSANLISVSTIDKIYFDVEIASVKKTYRDVIVKNKSLDKEKIISFTFEIKLSDFKLTRPSLLGISIDDKVKISVESVWHTE